MPLHRQCLSLLCDNLDLCVLVLHAKNKKIFFASWSAQALLRVKEGGRLEQSLDPTAIIAYEECLASLQKDGAGIRKINVIVDEHPLSLDFSFFDFNDHYILIKIDGKRAHEAHDSIIALEERLSAITRLSDGIAHNLRSPLMALRGISDYMIFMVASWEQLVEKSCVACPIGAEKDKVGLLLSQMRDDIKNNVTVMTDIISNLRAYNKVDRANELARINIIELIHKSIKVLEYNTKLAAEISFISPDEEIPLILCIPSDIQVVITNIIENAIEQILIKNKKDGKIVVSIIKQARSISIRIRDNGGGIEPRLLSSNELFEPFVTTKKNEGTGLGLHSSFKIIKEHRGNIFAKNHRSKIGTGAEFIVVLPI